MKFFEEQVESLRKGLKSYVYTEKIAVENIEYTECEYKVSNNFPESGWKSFDTNINLQGKDKHYWFRFHINTPQAKDEYKKIELWIINDHEDEHNANNPQSLVYLNGIMTQGLDTNHSFVELEFGKSYDVDVYFYLGRKIRRAVFEPSIRILDTRIEKLWYDISVPFEAAKLFDKEKDEYIQPIRELAIATNFLDFREPYSGEFYESIESCSKYLKENYYDRLCGEKNHTVNLVGHTHIDVAWMWTLAQTKEKAQRSFATVINLMKQYPEYQFMSSQPQLYEYVKEEAPELYEEIKSAVKEGRWEAEGAMWLEADCNLPSGESLIRQIIFGKDFFMQEFAVNSEILWLPDVFGYSAAMPQIMKKCGINKFVTSKISWNQYNRMPHDTFIWQGIDGTEIFTHFMTAQDAENENYRTTNYVTYGGYINPKQVYGTYKRNSDKHYVNDSMITFGYADGGGGPTKDMLEQGRRLEKGLVGLPAVRIVSVTEYLNKLETDFRKSCRLHRVTPKWSGELYLEFHRGTYTNMSKNKKYNRKAEFLLQSVEAFSVIAKELLKYQYKQDVINANWKKVLLNQFHDIIPGSSIKEVYDVSHEQYEQLFAQMSEVKSELMNIIAGNISSEGGFLVFNPCSFNVTEAVKIGNKYQIVDNIPAYGWKVVRNADEAKTITVDDKLLENDFVRVRFDDSYNITSVYDKKNEREIVLKGSVVNQIQIFEDRPNEYDAWELAVYHEKKMWTIDNVTSVRKFDDGAKAGFEVVRNYKQSVITQRISLNTYSTMIEFDTKVDWHEDHVILKAAFPLDIHTNYATYDIQFGNVVRPITRNNSWEEAKYEVCAHKWADLSEADYGVAVINDCKYGYSVDESTMRLSLLKASEGPNPEADRGINEFKYALYPHGGNVYDSNVITEAYKFNSEFCVCEVRPNKGILPCDYSFINSNNNDVIIETVKKAEHSEDVVVRMYASKNKRSNITVRMGFDVKEVHMCDMLENAEESIEVKDNTFELVLKPYEIITLLIKRQ